MDKRLKEYLDKQIKKHQDGMEAEASLIKMFKDAKKVATSKEKVDQVMGEYAQVAKSIHGNWLEILREEIKRADNWREIAHETLDQQIDQRNVFIACHAWTLQELNWIRDEAYLLDSDELAEEKEEEKEEGTKRDLTITISGDEVAVLKAQREIREEVFQLTGKYPDEEKKGE